MADNGEAGRRFPSEADAKVLQDMATRDAMDANQDPSLLTVGQHEYVTALQALAGMATSS